MAELTRHQIEEWLALEETEFYIDRFREKHQISPETSNLYVTFNRLCSEKKLRALGRGLYRKVKHIDPVKWMEADEEVYFDLAFPTGHEDFSGFGFDDLISVSPGDLGIISGVSNAGKSALALSFLGENVDKHGCVLMGNEYTTLDARPSPKFKRRMMNMKWVNWINGDGQPKFDLLPVRENFEDYIVPGKVNIIDWINLTDQFYRIGGILEEIKAAVGDGIAIVVLQKEENSELGRGKGFTRDLADFYFSIDPFGDWQGRLTVGKVKAPKKRVTGRMWAFRMVDSGANLHDIRELVKCPKCWGKGWKNNVPCDTCGKMGYIDL